MNNATYTAKDIEAYHQGRLSAAQMHALEEASLADPFLADALEGYRFSPSPAADRAALEQRLTQRLTAPHPKKIVALNSPWLKIAAALVVVIGVGVLLRQTRAYDNNGVQTQQQTQTVAVPPTAVPDSTSVASKSAEVATDSQALSNTVAVNSPKYKAVAPGRTNVVQGGYTTTLTTPGEDKQLSQVSTEPTAAPQAFSRRADSSMVPRKDNTTADIQTRSPRADTVRNLNVVMKAIPMDKEDVVVMNKKAKVSNTRPQPVIDTLEPAQGWSNFDDYVASNINQPDEYKTKPQGGEVELLFDVNAVGEPVNIVVTKSLCGKCDEEAIRLLKEGPKWTAKKKKGKVKIKF